MARTNTQGPRLESGSRVAVIGGGPAGSFFSTFLLQTARRVGLDVAVDIYEPRQFHMSGPRGCNMCGGIVSETLVQTLAAEGIPVPVPVIHRRIDSYYMHMDVGSVLIKTPREEKRIAAVHRGSGPRGYTKGVCESFDGYLLDLAREQGAQVLRERVDRVGLEAGRPCVWAGDGKRTYDLLAPAVGVNTSALQMFEDLGIRYKAPTSVRAYISEFHLGLELTRRYIGSSMHVFLLDVPRLEFAALIPKSDFVTVCLLGEDIDDVLVKAFLNSPEVREVMPPHWKPPRDHCHCAPHINVGSAVRPFADRVVFVGDCGTTRLYKDGIGAAYRTAKSAAVTAVLEGIAAEDFRKHYWPTCRAITADNRLGKLVFFITSQIRKYGYARRGLWRMVAQEQQQEGIRRRMSLVLWDTFTGSAPYKQIFQSTLHPAFLGRFLWEAARALLPSHSNGRRSKTMIKGVTGALGKTCQDGEVIYRQGELGDCMYIVLEGEVEVLQRRGEQEFCLKILKAGDYFGEMALFEQDVRAATVRALGKAVILTLEKGNLLRRIHEEPTLAFNLLEKMSRRIRDLETSLVGMGSRRETPDTDPTPKGNRRARSTG